MVHSNLNLVSETDDLIETPKHSLLVKIEVFDLY